MRYHLLKTTPSPRVKVLSLKDPGTGNKNLVKAGSHRSIYSPDRGFHCETRPSFSFINNNSTEEAATGEDARFWDS
jgi:hypothetical protein